MRAWLVIVVALACGCRSSPLTEGDGAAPIDLAPPQCSSGPITVTEAGSIASASASGFSCAGAQQSFPWKTGAAGSACTSPLDCQPTCCACAPAGRSAVTSWCNQGTCATAEQVCCALLGTPTNSCGTK